jgi:hypothetical protein
VQSWIEIADHDDDDRKAQGLCSATSGDDLG